MKCESKKTLRFGFSAIAVLLALLAGVLPRMTAQESSAQARAVRLSYVDGQVQISQREQLLTDQGVANTPLFEGTRLTTGPDGRAEVQFEDGSVARISPDSSLTLATLRSGGDTEIELNSGLGYFEMQGTNQSNSMRVRFGQNLASASGFTVLRISLDEMPGDVAVFSGNARLEGPANLALDLHGGQSVKLSQADPAGSEVADSIEPDSWDAWNSDRDQALTTAETGASPAAAGTGNANNPAWGDLNANGSWYNLPDQGYVWSPYEASNPDWDPYGSGYWVAQPTYGYVWVSGEPWGYMPYQCGAWNWYNSFGWGWAPGGCRPWWGSTWVVNIGTSPRWYTPPRRPMPPPHPIRPHPLDGVRIGQFGPVIPVHRRQGGENALLPSRQGGGPVTIAGRIVEPLRPLPNRPHYNHIPRTTARPLTGPPHNTLSQRPGYMSPPEAAGRPENRPAPSSGLRQVPTMPRPADGWRNDQGNRNIAPPPPAVRPTPPPAARPTPPPPVVRPSAPPVMRPSVPTSPRPAAPAPAPRPSAPPSAPHSGPHR